VAAGPAFPLVQPNPVQGKAIYAEKCAPCHGDSGLGDGPQASKLSNPVTAIGKPEVARPSTPSDWYNIITYGNLERFMPGFVNGLSDGQRWDVLAYAYSLSSPESELAQGQEIYSAECAACHGDEGQGDGAQASSLAKPPGDFTNQQEMSGRSLDDLYQTISSGSDPMPAYSDKLSESERWAVASYVRSFSLGAAQMGQQVAEVTPEPSLPAQTPGSGTPSQDTEGTPFAAAPETNPEAVLGTVTGKVTNGSGGKIPADLQVTLRGYDSMEEAFRKNVPVQPDGSYTVSDVEMPAGRVFMTTVDYNEATFNSDVAHPTQGTNQIDLPVVIYDNTSDTSSLSVDRMHVFFDFSNPGMVQVVELFIISNPSGKMVAAAEPGGAVLTFDLPEGASNLQFQEGALGDRYIQTEKGFGDTANIVPGTGQHQVLYAFDLPYDNKLQVELPLPLPVQAAVVMVPELGVKAQSEQLQDSGSRDVQGTTFHVYSGNGLGRGENLVVSLSGRPRQSQADSLVTSGSQTNLFIGMGIFGVALVLSGLLLYRARGRGEKRAPAHAAAALSPSASAPGEADGDDADTILEAIIALDDLFRAGKLPEQAYQERRALLKAQLREKMKES